MDVKLFNYLLRLSDRRFAVYRVNRQEYRIWIVFCLRVARDKIDHVYRIISN